MQGNSGQISLPLVADKCKIFVPPYPVYETTVCGQAFLCFFTKKFGFSNHFLTEFTIDAKYFYYNSLAEEIMLTNDPSTIKRLGSAHTMKQRQATGAELNCRAFDHDEWGNVKKNVMLTALRAKFEQNVQLFNMLIETENAMLIEASIGCSLNSQAIKIIDNWRGSNQMGNLLMQLRHEFRSKAAIRGNFGAYNSNA
uniref:NADAR domain-containing protein n=1 Tax=Meloidogyne javanica TaxID=6303 RepID=A0A915MV81_MELJA